MSHIDSGLVFKNPTWYLNFEKRKSKPIIKLQNIFWFLNKPTKIFVKKPPAHPIPNKKSFPLQEKLNKLKKKNEKKSLVNFQFTLLSLNFWFIFSKIYLLKYNLISSSFSRLFLNREKKEKEKFRREKKRTGRI